MHAVLVRCRVNRLSRIDRVTGEPIRRYEHPHPGSLIHVDVTKFGNIPDGGGWRYLGKQQGDRNRSATVARDRRAAQHANHGRSVRMAESAPLLTWPPPQAPSVTSGDCDGDSPGGQEMSGLPHPPPGRVGR